MCPDQQLLSIYLDGELPSPWKEKIQEHTVQCSACKERLESFQRLQNLLAGDKSANRMSLDMSEQAKARVWEKFETRRSFRPRSNVWQRRISIPLPAAAAAAAVVLLLAVFWLRIGNAPGWTDPADKSNFTLAAEMEKIEEIPGMVPAAADMNGVLQYLAPANSGTNIIILQLPESQSFFRAGEPEIIRAADFSRR